MSTRSRLGSLVLTAGLVGTGVTAVGLAAPASAAIPSCSATGLGGSSGFYPGPAASNVYDDTFAKGPGIPGLPGYTPQGITTWSNWDGNGHSLLVLGAYRRGHTSRLFGIDPVSGKTIGDVKISETHLGGLAVVGKWLITQGSETTSTPEQVRRYKLSDLRSKLKASGTPTLGATGSTQKIFSADYMSSYGGRIWSGRFSAGSDSKMYEYKVSSDGKLSVTGTSYQVPPRTQGLMVTSDRFVFSTSLGLGQSNMYVVRRGSHTLSAAEGRCFRMPSMGEGVTRADGKVFVVYESGADQYRDGATNVITNLHKGSWSTLSALTN
jgi:hypothetical protein